MRHITIVAATALLTACGSIAAMPKKMDKTNNSVGDMNNKMDRTNGGLDTMNGKVDQTNTGLGEMNGKMDRTNNGLDTMNGKMDQTNAGLNTMNGKMDATNAGLDSTNKKLDTTNTSLDATNTKIDSTNAGVTSLNDKVGETNGSITTTNTNLLSMLDEIRKTNTSMDTMNGALQTTSTAIHNQILLLSVQEMTKAENTLVLFPPVGMMPSGKKFAEEANADEALELTHAWLQEYDYAAVDADSLRAAGYADADIARMQAQVTHQKEAKFVGLEVIHGFMPQAGVEQVARHILEGGRYKNAALSGLALRAVFISTVLLQGDLLRSKLTRYGEMLDAVERVAYIDYLGRLPFADQIAFTTLKTGTVKFDAKSLLTYLYGELDQRFDSDLDAVYRQSSADPVIQKQIEELTKLHQLVRENAQYWAAR